MGNGFINRGSGVSEQTSILETLYSSGTVVKTVTTASYSILPSDNKSFLFFTNENGCDITFNSLSSGFSCSMQQGIDGSPLSFISGSATVNVSSLHSAVSRGLNAIVQAIYRDSATVTVFGELVDA